jgi:aryl-alcohol dehydrogenase-like predicted oxidoreductase
MDVTRKEFLGLTAASGAALILGSSALAAPAPIARRKIPKSGEMLPVIGLGTARTFDVEGTPEELAPRKEVLRQLFEGGGSVIDTSPSYGEAERVTGELLASLGARDRAFIATKISTRGDRDEGIQSMKGSATRLKTDHFDLMQVHNLKNLKTHLKSIRELRDAGKTKYVGVTHFRPGAYEHLEKVLKSETLDFVQLKYSLSTREAENRLLPLAKDKGVAVLINRPYDLGRLFRAAKGKSLPPWATDFGAESWGQFFLKFILSQDAVTCVIPGTRKPKHMVDNLGAGRGPLPNTKQRQIMVRFLEEL